MAASPTKTSVESVDRKFSNVTNTQDSVQGLSLWIIHHKTDYKLIVEGWLKSMKSAVNLKHRLTLFNVCNDVCQNGKRKKALVYLVGFKDALKAAMPLVRDKSIKNNVQRILKIWEERHIFPKDFIKELQTILDAKDKVKASTGVPTGPTITSKKFQNAVSNSPATPESSPEKPAKSPEPEVEPKTETKVKPNPKILATFKPQMLIDRINDFKRLEGEVELKGKQLSHLKLDASSVEAIKQLKDRSHGKQFSKQFDESSQKLEEYVVLATKELAEQKDLIELMEQSELFYEEQYKEAKIVANAYKNYGTRINNQRKKLEDLKSSLPSPIPSPTLDAPSPGNTPPQLKEDNIDTVDMEIDDDEITGKIVSDAPVPVAKHRQSTAAPDALESRIATMLPNLKQPTMTAANSIYNPPPVYKPSQVLNQNGEDTDGRKDEGGATPVMDENTEDSPPRSKPHNPMDFLTQILSNSSKTAGGTDFLQNMSLLTNTVKPKPDIKAVSKDDDDSESKQEAWAKWKEKNTPVVPPPSSMPSSIAPPIPPPILPPQFGPVPPVGVPSMVSPPARIASIPPPAIPSISSALTSLSAAITPNPQIMSSTIVPSKYGMPPMPATLASSLENAPALSISVRAAGLTSPTGVLPPSFVGPRLSNQPSPIQPPAFSAPMSSAMQAPNFATVTLGQSAGPPSYPSDSWRLSSPSVSVPPVPPPILSTSNFPPSFPKQDSTDSSNVPWEPDSIMPSEEEMDIPREKEVTPKSILRNRKSSLREIPIVDSEISASVSQGAGNDAMNHGTSHIEGSSNAHQEFLAKLKRKTAGSTNLLVPPAVQEAKVDSPPANHIPAAKFGKNPLRSNLTTIMPADYEEDNCVASELNPGGDFSSHDQSEQSDDDAICPISTIQRGILKRYPDRNKDDIRFLGGQESPGFNRGRGPAMPPAEDSHSHRDRGHPDHYKRPPPADHFRGRGSNRPPHPPRNPFYNDPYGAPPPPKRPYEFFEPQRRPRPFYRY